MELCNKYTEIYSYIPKNVLSSVICTMYEYKMIDNEKILELRVMNSEWRDVLNDIIPNMSYITSIYNHLNSILYYDKTVYDKFYYKRKVISRKINRDEYNLPLINTVEEFDYDIDGQDCKQYMICGRKFPLDFYIFHNIYKEFSTPLMRLYPVKILKVIYTRQYLWLEELILESQFNEESKDTILLTPLMYVKHYSKNKDDPQYIASLCYVNIIDQDIKNDTNTNVEKDKYIIMKTRMDNIENNEFYFTNVSDILMDKTYKIRNEKDTVKNCENTIMSALGFKEALSELITCQNFNL